VAELVGTVKSLWRFPVKSMRGERVGDAIVTERGLIGDRAYALRDSETGKVVSAKHARLGPQMFRCRAVLAGEPVAGTIPPPVWIELPDGTEVATDDPGAEAALERFFGYPVALEPAREDATIAVYRGHLEQLRTELLQEVGLPPSVALGAFFDLTHVTVLTTSTLRHAAELSPGTRFDERRFRMNVILDTDAAGFLENGWLDRELRLGEEARLRIGIPTPRCVMTTLPQEELPKEPAVLKTLGRHNRLEVAGTSYPCAGVYATVESPGRVRAGDPVWLL
jgi:uncharacterized protein YcbX